MPGTTNELHQLRAEIAALGEVKHLRRYPLELRRRIAKHALRRKAAGESQAAIAKSLDMSDPTLSRYVSADSVGSATERRPRARPRSATVGTLIPIAVTPDDGGRHVWSHEDRRVVVRGPSGLLIEGLSIGALAELIARVAACSD